MTYIQRVEFRIARKLRDERLRECAAATLGGDAEKARSCARSAAMHEAEMLQIACESYCPDCGAATNEECSATCGYDGPTPSDALADATEASRD